MIKQKTILENIILMNNANSITVNIIFSIVLSLFDIGIAINSRKKNMPNNIQNGHISFFLITLSIK